MATLYITEYEDVGPTLSQIAQAPQEPRIANQTVAIGGTSTQSSAFNVRTRLVRLHTDAICSVDFGASPTAVATESRMAANTTEFFGVTPGHKVAVITNT